MKRNIIIASTLFLFLSSSLIAQLTVQDGLTAEEMAASITGTGVTILNPQITGAPGSFGGFEATGIPNFTLQEGLLLSTGKIEDAIGPNLQELTSTVHNPSISSPILEMLTGTLVTNDAVKLEFDIIPDGDTLKFNFSFASEEYKEFVCTPFDDIFGFFISGPGIIGDPGMGGRKNIALLPGTDTPVTINNVNSGNPTADDPCPPVNQIYHHENPLSAIGDIQFDGWTKDLVAIASDLVPCEVYHLEIIIADVSDKLYDSGVFIEKIESNNVEVAINTVAATETMIEGCNDGIIEFCTPEPVTTDLTLEFLLSGNAINGVDYDQIGDLNPNIPKEVVILAGSTCATVNINTIDDGVTEGQEFVDVILLNPICDGLITDSVRAFILDELEIEIDANDAICSGESVLLSAIGNASTYQWGPSSLDFIPSDDIANPIVTLDESTTITLTTTLAGCTATDNIFIDVTNFDLDYTFIPDGCSPSTCDGSISVEVSGGVEPYLFDWGTGETTPTITNVCAGTYTLSVIDVFGCTKRDTVELELGDEMTVLLSPFVYNGGFNIACSGQLNGSIATVVSGGVGDYTYQWDDASNSTGAVLSGVGAGTYTVIVTDSLGCEVIQSITLTQPDPLQITLEDQTNVSCSGSTGAIEISGSGGTPNYTFVWTLNGDVVGSGTTLSSLAAGTYIVTMTDQNNCNFMQPFEITEPTNPLSGTATVNDESCFGENDGSILAMGQGGFLNIGNEYTYVWLDDLSTNPLREDLTPGTYQVEITDDNGCTFILSVVIDGVDSPLGINIITQEDITCAGQACAAVEVTGTGGSSGYTYEWNTVPVGPSPFSFSPSLEICSPGDYVVEVTDINGCAETENITISITSLPMSINATITNVDCDGDSSGAIDVTVSGGVPPYSSFVWTGDCGDGPFFTEDIAGICAGQWILLVTDAVGCERDFTLLVAEESDISLTFLMTPTLCEDDFSGALDITPIGGVGDYTYQWFGPAPFIGGPFDFGTVISTDQDITGQGKGEYLVIVTDENGCSYWQEIIISAPAAIEITLDDISDYNGFEVSCNGSCDGFINTSISGGTTSPVGDYTFMWEDQTQGFSLNTSGVGGEDISNLCASQDINGYQLIVIDDNDCIQNAFFVIDEPEPLEVSISNPVGPSCNGETDASVTASVMGGVPDYIFEWREGMSLALPVIETSPTLSDVGAGTYCVTITDMNDCSVTECITIEQVDILTVALNFVDQGAGFGVSCFGEMDGQILSTFMGGNGSNTYSWSNCVDDPFDVGTNSSISGLAAGTYCVDVEDSEGCIGSATITLTTPTEIINNAVVENIGCDGTTGSIDLMLTGGTGVYPIIDWTPDTDITDGSQTGTNLPAGNYQVFVEDSNGCSAEFDFVISGSEPINVTLTSPILDNGFNISCNGECDATLVANIVGGSGSPTITWTGMAPVGGALGNPTEFDGVVCAGTYMVEVVDGVCIGMDEITITEPSAITVDFTVLEGISCNGECDGQLEATASGGGGGYTYLWDNGDEGPITTATLCQGQHCVTVTDQANCSVEVCFTLTEPSPLAVVIIASPITCNAICDGTLTANPSGGTPGYNFMWTGPNDFMETTGTITDLCPGTYDLTVTDDNGCVFMDSFDMVEPEAIEVEIETSNYNGFGVSCDGECDGWIDVTYLGADTPNYSWVGPGSPAPVDSIFGLCEGLYVLTTSTSGTCLRIDSIEITSPDPIVIDLQSPTFPGGTNISCLGEESGAITSTVTGGFGNYNYFWVFEGDTIAIDVTEIDGLIAGGYTLIVVDENGCSADADITLTEPTESITVTLDITEFANGANTSCGDVCDGSITAVVTNGVGDINYSWTGTSIAEDDTLATVDELCAGTYLLIATDENQCFDTALDTLVPGPDLEILFDVDSVLCFGLSNGSIDISVVGSTTDIDYEWTGDISSDEEDLDGLGTGTYVLDVIDEFGCTAMEEFILSEPDTIIVLLTASLFPLEAPGFNLSGPGSEDGEINSEVTGGVEPYDYDWIIGIDEDGDPIISNDEGVSGLSGGDYCMTVTDANGCVTGQCIELLEPLELHLPNGISPNGDGMNDGLVIEGLELYPNNLVRVFNRWGNVVFEQSDYSNDDTWKGEGRSGNFVPDGTYFVLVDLLGSVNELHGYLEIRR